MPVEKLDLRYLTRDPKKCQTTVFVMDQYGHSREEWLVLGACETRSSHEGSLVDLLAYMNKAVDFEHDSAYALTIPLIGLQFDCVLHHTTCLIAWIDPNRPGSFKVPPQGYDPRKGAPKKHGDSIVAEGFYTPPPNLELYEALKGRRVEIRIGVPWDKRR